MNAPQPQPGLLEIAPYIGGESAIVGAAQVIRLASNEAALGPSPKAVEAHAAGANADGLTRYPDGGCTALRQALGVAHNLDPVRIVCGNGSDELICLLARAYAGPGDEVLYSAHGFVMYPISARAAGATPVAAPEVNLTTDVDAMLAHVTEKTRIVFIANPNNPTGSYLSEAALRRLHRGLREDILLVIDAAYAEYVMRDDYISGADLVSEFENVVMTRTFSKIHALAALRLGWAYCPEAVGDVLNRIRGPFNVNARAQSAGIASLKDAEHLEAARIQARNCLDWFQPEMQAIGLTAPISVGNFQLVRFPDATGAMTVAAYDHLVAQGILTRRMGGYGLPDCLRISVGTDAQMRIVAQSLANFMANAVGKGS